VVTGFTNLKSEITLDELRATDLLLPCELTETSLGVKPSPGGCRPAAEIADVVAADPTRIALLPPGFVEPKVKVLPVDGADLFGSAAARGASYPITGKANELPLETELYDASEIRTLMSVGESCPDRGVAYQAITLGKGWEYVFGGGTAAYQRVYPNPVGPGQVGDGFNIVDAVATGNDGAVWKLIGGGDLTVQDF